MKVYFAADHAGFDLKNRLMNLVRGELRHDIEDCGAFELEPNDDYPDIIASACRLLEDDIREGLDSRAIVLGASGQGEAIVANRFDGIRAIVYYGSAMNSHDASGNHFDIITASRAHNDANVLSLGARILAYEEAADAVRRWLSTPFSNEERHLRRIQKIDMLRDKNL